MCPRRRVTGGVSVGAPRLGRPLSGKLGGVASNIKVVPRPAGRSAGDFPTRRGQQSCTKSEPTVKCLMLNTGLHGCRQREQETSSAMDRGRRVR